MSQATLPRFGLRSSSHWPSPLPPHPPRDLYLLIIIFHILWVSLIMLQLLHRSQYCVVCFCLVLYFSFWPYGIALIALITAQISMLCRLLFALSNMLMLYSLYRFSYNKILNEPPNLPFYIPIIYCFGSVFILDEPGSSLFLYTV